MILGFWPKILPVHTYKIKAYKPIYIQKAEGHQYPSHNRSRPSLGPADRSCIKHPKGKRAVHCNFKRKIPQCIAQCPHTNIWQSKFWGEQKTKDEEQKSDAEILLWLFSFFSTKASSGCLGLCSQRKCKLKRKIVTRNYCPEQNFFRIFKWSPSIMVMAELFEVLRIQITVGERWCLVLVLRMTLKNHCWWALVPVSVPGFLFASPNYQLSPPLSPIFVVSSYCHIQSRDLCKNLESMFY